MPESNKSLVISFRLQNAAARTETFLGRTFRVIPAVLVRSQVLQNNIGRTFLPANEITDEWAEQWNGIPVLVGPHPSVRGQAVSARQPELWNERCAGWIFRARAEQESDDVRRLVGEVWLDEERASEVEGLPAVLEKVKAGEPVELSTGFQVNLEAREGMFLGERYEVVLHPTHADHLVISAEMTGACSVSDGCGLGVNKQEKRPMSDVKKGKFAALLERVGELVGREEPQPKDFGWNENLAARLARDVQAMNAVPVSDHERMMNLRRALEQKFGQGADKHVILEDVYSQAKQVVFWVTTPNGTEPPGPEYFRVSFAEDANGAFTFGEPEKVRRVLVYEPVQPAPAAQPAANTHAGKPCGCKEADMPISEQEKKDLVTELTAAFQTILKPVADKVENFGQVAKDAAETAVNAVKDSLEKSINAVKTEVGTLSDSVKALNTVVNSERDAERQALVAQLSTNNKTEFSAAELEAMPLEQLRKIAVLAKVEVTSYAGRGAPRAAENTSSEPQFAEPVPYFAGKKEKTATNTQDSKEGK